MKVRGIQRLMHIASLFALIAFTWMASVSTAHAQSTTGSIYGTVADTTGAIIPQAAITVKNVQTNETHKTASNSSGHYVFPALPPGDYVVTSQFNGFKTETQSGVRLDANQNVNASFTLNAGSTGESVTVEASTTLVDTRESQLGSTIDEKRLQELPLVGRDAYDLVALSPGVTNVSEGQNGAQGGQIGDPVGATFSTNGLRTFENSFYLDGANNTSYYRPGGNLAPSPDALQEFRILTSNFDAEFGSMPGGVVNMITKSGTNTFHGLLYDYVRNNIFNAKTWPSTVPNHLRQNTFGATFGGPLLHNKLFFFGSYQGLRIATNTVVNAAAATVPTGPNGTGPGQTSGASRGGERNGDFSTDTKKPICGATTFPCGGPVGVIPTAYLDPVVQNILKSIPIPATFNGTSGGATAQQTANAPAIGNQYLARGDYQLTGKHRISYLYFHESGNQASPTAGGQTVLGYAGDLITDRQDNQVGTDAWTIAPNRLNTIILYYSGNHYSAGDLFAGTNSLASLGAAIPDGGSPSTQPNVRIQGFLSLGNSGSAPNSYTLTTLGAADTFIWTHGNHTYKFGGSINRNKFYLNTVGQRAGLYTIGSGFSGNSLADLLLGKSASFTQNNGFLYNLHQEDPSLFAQDDWRISQRLTLNLGLRWEVFYPFHGENNMGSFNPNVQSAVVPTAPTGVLFAGDSGVPDGVLQTTYDKFAPRLGFAYDVYGSGRTSVRGGWGLFYSQVAAAFYSSLVSPLYAANVSINNTTNFSNPYTGSTTPVTPFPFTPNLKNPTFAAGLTFPAEPPNNKAVAYVMEYHLTIDQQVGRNWATSISYVGNAGRKFMATRDENGPVYSTTATAANALARRPYKPTTTSYVFNSVYEYDPAIASSYNSLQVTLTRRFAHRFSINANYVWAKSMTDGADPTANAISPPAASDSYNFKADYGKASQDQPQRFVASYVWVSPDIHLWGLFGKAALSGWRLNGITTLSTGQPFNITSGVDTNFDGVATTDRPNLVSSPFLPGGRSRAAKAAAYFNNVPIGQPGSSFAAVPAGTATGAGNIQFDMLIGPGRVNTDLSASKSFPFWRESTLQFRTEAFNLFSNVNLNNPASATNNSATLGKITSAAPGRVLQLALKLSF